MPTALVEEFEDGAILDNGKCERGWEGFGLKNANA